MNTFEKSCTELDDAFELLDREYFIAMLNEDEVVEAGIRYVNSRWQVYITTEEQ